MVGVTHHFKLFTYHLHSVYRLLGAHMYLLIILRTITDIMLGILTEK